MRDFEGTRIDPRRWIFLTTIGLAGGLAGGLWIGMPLGEIVNAMIVTAAVTCTVGGVLGSFQAAGLRRILPRPLSWVVATMIGLGVGLAVAVVTVEQVGIAITGSRPQILRLGPGMRALSFVAVGLVAGTILGAAQALVLRKARSKVPHWIAASGIALACAFSLGSLLVDLLGIPFASVTGALAFVALSGVTFGGLTSLPLRRA